MNGSFIAIYMFKLSKAYISELYVRGSETYYLKYIALNNIERDTPVRLSRLSNSSAIM